jgi:hypothetical protein
MRKDRSKCPLSPSSEVEVDFILKYVKVYFSFAVGKKIFSLERSPKVVEISSLLGLSRSRGSDKDLYCSYLLIIATWVSSEIVISSQEKRSLWCPRKLI